MFRFLDPPVTVSWFCSFHLLLGDPHPLRPSYMEAPLRCLPEGQKKLTCLIYFSPSLTWCCCPARSARGASWQRGDCPHLERWISHILSYLVIVNLSRFILSDWHCNVISERSKAGTVTENWISLLAKLAVPLIRVRNSNFGLSFLAFKCCASQLTVDQMSRNLVNFLLDLTWLDPQIFC